MFKKPDEFFKWQDNHYNDLRDLYRHPVFEKNADIKISEIEKKSKRDKIISEDDITDLKIALNSGTIDDFLNNL